MQKIQYTFLVLLLFCMQWATAQAEEELLEVDQAFAAQWEVLDANTLQGTWTIADGYYLYKERFKFKSLSPEVTLGEARFPEAEIKDDEYFGRMEIFHNTVQVQIPLSRRPDTSVELLIESSIQGCASAQGVCYPPHKTRTSLSLPVAGASQAPKGKTGSFLDELKAAPASQGAQEVLSEEDAFQFSAMAKDANTLQLNWDIAPGHYLYRHMFKFELLDGDGVQLAEAVIPAGEEKDDEFFGLIEVYHEQVEIQLPLLRTDTSDDVDIELKVSYQGCSEVNGICYPPTKKTIELNIPEGGMAAAGVTTGTKISEQDSLAQTLATGNMFTTLLLFFGLGLLLTFTPCVFPMIPILSSIIIGHGEHLTTRKAFVLSLVYVLAMALTYTVAGVVAGLFGSNLQAAFQNPWVLGSFSGIFVLLSLSMFGFYQLQLPSALQSRLTEISSKQAGGSLSGVAIMGLLSALIVGPCVAPPLMGALIYIGQTGDAVLGGAALFAMSMGMGVPLLLIGTSAGKFLPHAGAWMDAVKAVFGVMLLAVAIWMLERILPAAITLLLWAMLAIVSAIYMGALETIREGQSGWYRLWKGLGVLLLLQGGLMLIGLAMGNTDPLQPLKGVFASNASTATTVASGKLAFKKIHNLEELQSEVAQANAVGKTVMLDFYADWCVSCKEYERYTFSDPGVQAALANTVLLKADVTENNEQDQALMQHFSIIGPPAMIFYDLQGRELTGFRLVGFLEAQPFIRHVEQAFPQP